MTRVARLGPISRPICANLATREPVSRSFKRSLDGCVKGERSSSPHCTFAPLDLATGRMRTNREPRRRTVLCFSSAARRCQRFRFSFFFFFFFTTGRGEGFIFFSLVYYRKSASACNGECPCSAAKVYFVFL